jgi:purine nucleosidase/pyrimidine-specific ribonucleoside hydrolase
MRIVLDCDPGHDDAFAILLAFASPELELVGVTTVSGNQTLDKTTANALRVLELCGGGVPVAAGADRPLVRERYVAAYVHGETGLDGPDLPPPSRDAVAGHAVDFLAEHVAGATLVATGPLTNVALLQALRPDARPERLVLMGGAIGEGNTTPSAEFNVWADPEAAARVFQSDWDVTMVGLDVTHRALITPAHRERLRAAGRVGRVGAELLDFYGRFHAQNYPEFGGGSPMHDPVCVAHLLDDSLLELRRAFVEVDCGWGQGRGRTNVHLHSRTLREHEPNASVAVGIDGARFADLLVERVGSLR